MVSRFRRTVSFPKPSITSSSEKSYHIRSVSLPCRSHPLISQLNDEINNLRSWESESDERNSFWLCDGLLRLKNLHGSFDDYLQLSKTQESLRRQSNWIEKLLEDFLRFIDVFGIFRATLVSFKEEQSLVQVAIRRRDELKISSYVKNRKKIDKELKKLVSNVRFIGKCSVSSNDSLSYNDDAELSGVVKDLMEVTISFTISMLNSISGSSSMTSCIGSKLLMKKKKQSKSKEMIQEIEEIQMEGFRNLIKEVGDKEVRNVLKKLEVLENCVVEIESESGKMFRSLMNTRVSLLNIVTQ